jgi:hypothetical protein
MIREYLERAAFLGFCGLIAAFLWVTP